MMLPPLSEAKVAETQTCKHCRQAQRWYGQPCWGFQKGDSLCSGGCDTHSECDSCDYCDLPECACQCAKCAECGRLETDCRCCSSCGSNYCGTCDECEEAQCECTCEDEYCGGGNDQHHRFGSIQTAPWVSRGVDAPLAPYGSAQEAWGIATDSVDLAQSAADFYLLEAMIGGVVSPARQMAQSDTYSQLLTAEAKALFGTLVGRLDKTFRGYVDMIIGGELRHHRAAGSASLRGDRSDAWRQWRSIRTAGGPTILADAEALFLDFNSTAYGGEAWATIAKVLLARETNQIRPAMFIDRVFNLQHNGGSLFDKASWAYSNRLGWGMSELQTVVLPAHGARTTPWNLLLAVASDEVRDLFHETWRQGNRILVAVGERAVRIPANSVPMYDDYWGRRSIDYEAVMVLAAH